MNQPRHHPLAHLALAAGGAEPVEDAGVALTALPYRPSLILRGESGDEAFTAACRAALGFDLPLAPNHAGSHGAFTALWLGPSEWLIMGEDAGGRLRDGLAGCRHAIVLQGDGRQIIALSGPRARDVLAKLCPLDLESPDLAPGPAPGPGCCARSLLARCDMLLHPQPDGAYHIHVSRSLADYAWRTLAEAGREYGVALAVGD